MFTSPEGGFLRHDNFRRRVWVPAVEKSGLAPLKFQSLRHTAAAFIIFDGSDPLQVRRRMGHEDIRTAYGTYGHLFPDREDELVAALDRRRSAGLERDVDQAWTKGFREIMALKREKGRRAGLLMRGPEGN